jgi:hypothetical protein
MWDLATIIQMNHEKESAKKKDPIASCKQKEIKGNEGVQHPKDRVFNKASYLRGVYEGTIDGCASSGGTGETLP